MCAWYGRPLCCCIHPCYLSHRVAKNVLLAFGIQIERVDLSFFSTLVSSLDLPSETRELWIKISHHLEIFFCLGFLEWVRLKIEGKSCAEYINWIYTVKIYVSIQLLRRNTRKRLRIPFSHFRSRQRKQRLYRRGLWASFLFSELLFPVSAYAHSAYKKSSFERKTRASYAQLFLRNEDVPWKLFFLSSPPPTLIVKLLDVRSGGKKKKFS